MSRSRVIPAGLAVVALVGASVFVGALSAQAYTPPAPIITDVGSAIADNSPLVVSGTAEHLNGTDQTVEVHLVHDGSDSVYCTDLLEYFDGPSTTEPFSCVGGPLPYGEVSFYAVQWEDMTPLEVSEASNQVTYTIGSSDPTTFTGPTAGSSTLDSTPTFTGTGPVLGTVSVIWGATTLCSTTVGTAGTWSCDSTPLSSSDGSMFDSEETYLVDAQGEQVDGVVQPVTSTTDITILQPQAPLIDYYYAGTPPWQTGNQTPWMQGSMGLHTANATVWISTDGVSWWHYCNEATDEGATVWFCTAPSDVLQPGTNLLAVSTQNEYGNQSFLSAPITVELVGNPTITSIPDGTYTNDPTPTIAGTAPFGASIQVYKDSGPSPSTFLCNGPVAAGAFGCDTVPLVDGAYTVHVYSNQGIDVSSAPISFTVDTVAPSAPVVTTSGGTNDTTPIISGTAEPGSTVTLYRDGSPVTCDVMPIQTAGDGSWSCQTVTPLTPGGTYGWGATQQDLAGNLSDAGIPPMQTTLTILVPPAPPPAPPLAPEPTPLPTPSPTVPAPLVAQPWSFEFAAGGSEFQRGDSTELTGAGLPAGAIVEAEFHSTPVALGSTSVSDAGAFVLPVTIPMDAEAGEHNFVVTITPATGLPSTQVQPVTVVVPPKALGQPGDSQLATLSGAVSAEGAERSDPGAPSALTLSIDPIQSILSNPVVIGGAAIAGFALLLLVAFPAELLNSTISENYQRLARRIPPVRAPWWERFATWLQTTPLFGAIAMTITAAIIFGFVDPNFGLDITSFRLVLASAIALFVLTYLSSVLSGALIRRWWGLDTRIELKPLGLVLTIVGVVLSRLLEFTPGVLLGLFLGLGLVGATTVAQRAKATLVQVGVVFSLALLGWVGYSILVATTTPDTFATTLAFDTLVVVTAEGLTALFVGLLPIRMLIGPGILDYSKTLWALVYALVATAFVLIVLPSAWGEIDGPVWTWVIVLVGFAVVSLAVYLFFRFTSKEDDDEDGGSTEEPARESIDA